VTITDTVLRADTPGRYGEHRTAAEVRRGWHVQDSRSAWHLVQGVEQLAEGRVLLLFVVGAIAYLGADRLQTCTPAEWIARHEPLQQAADAELATFTALCKEDQ
jgi:hypothetical protein